MIEVKEDKELQEVKDNSRFCSKNTSSAEVQRFFLSSLSPLTPLSSFSSISAARLDKNVKLGKKKNFFGLLI